MGAAAGDELRNEIEAAFRADRGYLFALGYRLTGSAAEAEDIVQETFARAVAAPPLRRDLPWRPWLARVAVNLGLDALRRRRRRGRPAAWLPEPLTTPDELAAALPDAGEGAAARYERLESASFAFLLALEALTPRQRAVLILADVLEYSAQEAAEALGMSAANARVTLHRARRALHAYDAAPSRPTPALEARTRHALESFLRCIVAQDVAGLEALLAEDARTVTDGGARYTALPAPLEGRARVMRLYLQVAKRRAAERISVHTVNGLPALLIEFARTERRQAPCALIRCELDASGRIRELHTILGPEKLGRLLAAPPV